jgi:hypothetical protein
VFLFVYLIIHVPNISTSAASGSPTDQSGEIGEAEPADNNGEAAQSPAVGKTQQGDSKQASAGTRFTRQMFQRNTTIRAQVSSSRSGVMSASDFILCVPYCLENA